MRQWPAVDVAGVGDTQADPDLVLAAVDEFKPTAAEHTGDTFRLFFETPAARDRARDALASGHYQVASIDVGDDDWARRSQQGLEPVTVDRITVFPKPEARSLEPADISIVIVPSMGFGTGHHATTRLCLAALQQIDVAGRSVIDVGTGSGILAIAASMLGASQVLAVDTDADAIQAATENLQLNPAARVALEVADLNTAKLPTADIVLANLTGALLQRAARALTSLVQPDGILVLSGFLEDERRQVREAFSSLTTTWEQEEQGWMGLAMKRS